ncbi:MAG TPA: methylated-DNA--[protein]-cysteine S-methyltransferase [Capillimicrobium sp.]|nr:methylated-DNA--[protein]-cysteine S-methyltransferase [Capillimicrobium sp.]
MTPLTPPSSAPPPDLVDRLIDRAADAGLLDVAYAAVDSPLGTLVAARTPRGLAVLSYADVNGGVDAVAEQLATRLSPRVLEAPARLDDVRRELDEYFAGRRTRFDLPLDLGLVRTDFGRRVLRAATAIPFGETRTYRDVAAGAGNERAIRAAGTALGRNPIPIVVPCHRVLRSGGGLGGYTGGLERKAALLSIEGARS